MTRDELEATILKSTDMNSVERESNEWFSKYHDKNYTTKGLKPGEYTFATIKDEIQLSRMLRSGYLQLNPLPVNKFMNESALIALLAFFEARAKGSSQAEGALWSLHADALRTAMTSRGLKIGEPESFFV